MICIQCNKEFEAKRTTAKYCSVNCRIKASRVSVSDSVSESLVSVSNDTVKVSVSQSVKQGLSQTGLNYDMSEISEHGMKKTVCKGCGEPVWEVCCICASCISKGKSHKSLELVCH